ncbi:GNAT family N-acetyltransferase [Prochlorothrix hollandica]|uniref:GNAT family N-acetyltransferase n=1 Tax=Prochlorothrix hollandica TaxID=1223 RepID=UPI0003461F59|nr:GNAT family N-acetyltransferase [Prochlorothrix hollandica]
MLFLTVNNDSMDCSHVYLKIHQPRWCDAPAPVAAPVDPRLQWDYLPSLEPALDLQQLRDLFTLTAHWAGDRHLEDLRVALAHSNPVVSAHAGDRLVGFSRATSDGAYRATIWDVVVHPDLRGGGIGRKLVQTILSHPYVNRVERVYLMTSHKQRFYEHIGFQTNDSTTMVLQNQNQSLEIACATTFSPVEQHFLG